MTDRLFKNGFYSSLALQSSHSPSFCYHFTFQSNVSARLERSQKTFPITHSHELAAIYHRRVVGLPWHRARR
jgi:hypothetical protein